MELNLIGRAIGACLSEADNLRAIYLPEGAPNGIAEAIVREANSRRPVDPPFAILVSSDCEGTANGVVRVLPENVIKYRQDDRLVVAVGRHTDYSSISTSFAEVFGLSYPQSASGSTLVSLEQLAGRLLELILTAAGISPSVQLKTEVAALRLKMCLEQLRDVHLEMRRGDIAWNAQWFRHVERGADHLAEFLSAKVVAESDLDLDDALQKYTFAAFSLPRPGETMLIKRSGVGKAVVEALDSWWSDGAMVWATAQHLRHHRDTESDRHPLEALDWSGFDRDAVAEGNPLIALLCKGQPVVDVVEAFGGLTVNQFLDPSNRLAEAGELVVRGADGEDLSASELPDEGPFLITSRLLEDGIIESQRVRIRIPTLAPPTTKEVQDSTLTLGVAPAAFTWDGALEIDEEKILWAVGHFTRHLKGQKPKPVQPATVSLQVKADDLIAHMVPPTATCAIHILPPKGAGVTVFRQGKGGLMRPVFLGPETFAKMLESETEPGNESFPWTLDDDSHSYRIVAWAKGDAGVAIHDGKAMDLLKGREGMYAATIKPNGLDVVELADQRFEIRAAERKSSVQSPIVAAIDRQQVSGDMPGSATLDSVRGLLESEYARSLRSGKWLRELGHIALPADRDEIPFGEFEPGTSERAFLMHPLTSTVWGNLTDERVPEELISSAEADAFRDAFSALGLAEAMGRAGSESSEALDWPSRTSWRHLWLERRDALDAYLAAYEALISRARAGGSAMGLLWAAYPFCATVWNMKDSLQCTAVMLSPLHPIRLAWLASVEGTLWEAEDAGGLAGTIEGWNLPLIGPRHTKSGRMVAIPMDSGEGQLFLGWSMLVGASVDGPEVLTSPYRIGRLAAPGSAASGLNATAATSALRDYRRMHPHVSTLTIDLAAATKTTRLEEVDQAVIAQLQAWAGEKSETFRGGARVLDSLCREGDVPSSAIAELAKKNLGMPLLWSRYVPTDQTQACNIRLLQDSGVRLEVGAGVAPNLGVISGVPLRRFEAGVAPEANANSAQSRPALEAGRGGWEPFAAALRAIEWADGRPQLSSKLHKSALVDERADWTVSGESLLSPAAMATLVQSGAGGSQMLWEWRPPFLESADDIPALERRPFVSVARVPLGFKTRLKDMLDKVTGVSADDVAVGKLLRKLGARGVGLSSLLAMGGTHASGALGFYLAFALSESADGEGGAEHIALPIDACDTFLKALAGSQKHGDVTQRADVLIMSITDEALTLVPVEIKFYGSDAAGDAGHLPDPLGPPLKAARAQLESTTALLQKVEQRGASLRVEGKLHDLALWNNALTTLVEAGLRLKPAGSKTAASLPGRLQRVADGMIPVRVGSPIVTFFKHGAFASDGRSFVVSTDVAGLGEAREPFGALVANSRAAFAALDEPEGELVSGWKDLVRWATRPSEGAGQEVPVAAPSEFEDLAAMEAGHSAELPSGAPVGPESTLAEDSSNVPATVVVLSDSAGAVEPPDVPDTGIRFPVGTLLSSVGGGMAEFWPSNTALNQMNIGVVGDLGTGKTQLVKALIFQLRSRAKLHQENPLSMLVFDYKRDFQEAEFLSAVGGRVLRPEGIPLNIFALPGAYSPLAAFQRASSFCDILSKIYSGVGPVQRDRLVTVITDLFKERRGEPPTLAEVKVRYSLDSKPDVVTGILNTFVLGEVFSSDRSKLVSFEDLMEDTVLVVSLSDLGTDQNAKNSLVALFLNFYYDYMRNSKKWPFEGTDPQLRRLNSFLLVDEAVNIMEYGFDVLMDLMLQGREFGFGTILASQYLSHFKTGSGPNYGEPLLTWFIHKVPNVTVKQLAQLGIPGATEDAARRIADLNVHEAYYSSLKYQGRFIAGTPFYRLER